MKTQMTVMLAVCGLMTGVSLHAEKAAQKPQVVTSAVAESTKLSVEELAFAAKLSDSNRKTFIEKLTVEQRQLAMNAAKSATVADAADEAVSKIVSGGMVASAEDASSALAETESAQAE